MLKAKTKKGVQSLTLLQVVKIVESINLKQIPMTFGITTDGYTHT